MGGYHILVLTLPRVFFSGFQNWILNHSAREILLVGYFPTCVAASPSDSFARHKLDWENLTKEAAGGEREADSNTPALHLQDIVVT